MVCTYCLTFFGTDDSKELPDEWRGQETESSNSQAGAAVQASGNAQAREKKWEKDNWAFRYRHSKSSMTFVLKALRLGSRLSVHAFVVEQDDVVVSMELLVSQYVDLDSDSFKTFLKLQKDAAEGALSASKSGEISSSSTEPSSVPWTSFLKNLAALHERCKKEVMVRLMPEVEDLASQMRFQEPQRAAVVSGGQQQPQQARGDALRVEPRAGARLRRPPPSQFEEDYGFEGDEFGFDPQPPMYPPGGGGAVGGRGGGDGSHFGDADLFGSYGRYGQVPGGFRGGGGWNPESGGSQIGPHHPIFGPDVNDPYASGGYGIPRAPGRGSGGSGGSGGVGFHPPPRGARFDPFGPPVPPSANPPNSNPPPDAPPGFEGWYS